MTNQGPISDADRQLALGNETPLPTPAREPDPIVDGLANDGTPAETRGRDNLLDPSGGR
jgi:hypothetical protein